MKYEQFVQTPEYAALRARSEAAYAEQEAVYRELERLCPLGPGSDWVMMGKGTPRCWSAWVSEYGEESD